MTHQGKPELAIPRPLQELRDAMARVRNMQATSGMVVNLARYDAETNGINQEFLDGFFDTLPVEFGWSGNRAGRDLVANRFEIKDPVNVRPTTSFGVFIVDENPCIDHEAALVIGSRSLGGDRLPLTKLLLGQIERRTDAEEKRWEKVLSRVRTATVATDSWEATRDRGINLLHQPHNNGELMATFAHNLGAFVIRKGLELGTPRVEAKHWYVKDVHTQRGVRAYRRQESASSALVDVSSGIRSLRSSDFEAFDVMTHLEYIVAAYGVGKAFDEVKARREARMPAHPATTMLDLPDDYRQMMEQRGLHTLPQED